MVIWLQLGYAFCIDLHVELFDCYASFTINCFMSFIVVSYFVSLTFVEPKILIIFDSIVDKCYFIRFFRYLMYLYKSNISVYSILVKFTFHRLRFQTENLFRFKKLMHCFKFHKSWVFVGTKPWLQDNNSPSWEQKKERYGYWLQRAKPIWNVLSLSFNSGFRRVQMGFRYRAAALRRLLLRGRMQKWRFEPICPCCCCSAGSRIEHHWRQ